MNHPLVLSVKDTAARAGVPVSFVRRLVADKAVHYVTSGKKIYVSWASIEKHLLGDTEEQQ